MAARSLADPTGRIGMCLDLWRGNRKSAEYRLWVPESLIDFIPSNIAPK
jgi:hypothetical protein